MGEGEAGEAWVWGCERTCLVNARSASRCRHLPLTAGLGLRRAAQARDQTRGGGVGATGCQSTVASRRANEAHLSSSTPGSVPRSHTRSHSMLTSMSAGKALLTRSVEPH